MKYGRKCKILQNLLIIRMIIAIIRILARASKLNILPSVFHWQNPMKTRPTWQDMKNIARQLSLGQRMLQCLHLYPTVRKTF